MTERANLEFASERINRLMQELGYNPSSMAREIGVLPQRIRDVVSGKTKEISPDLANKILSCFPSVNRVWLLAGEGEMLLDESAVNISQHVSGNNNTVAGRDLSTFKGDLSELASVIGKQQDIISELTRTVSRQQKDISKLLDHLTKSKDE